jgi:hypothetical protein
MHQEENEDEERMADSLDISYLRTGPASKTSSKVNGRKDRNDSTEPKTRTSERDITRMGIFRNHFF